MKRNISRAQHSLLILWRTQSGVYGFIRGMEMTFHLYLCRESDSKGPFEFGINIEFALLTADGSCYLFDTHNERRNNGKEKPISADGVLSLLCECDFSTGETTGELEDCGIYPIPLENQNASFSSLELPKNQNRIFSCSLVHIECSVSGVQSPVSKRHERERSKLHPSSRHGTMRRMLQYTYTDVLEDLQLENASQLYEAADKYQILSLKHKCSSFLKLNLDAANACDVLQLSDLHHDEQLKKPRKLTDAAKPRSFAKTHIIVGAFLMSAIRSYMKSTGIAVLQETCIQREEEILSGQPRNKNALCIYSVYPLHEACQIGCVPCTEFLLNMGADVHKLYRGKNPLHEACQHETTEWAELLVKYGANINALSSVQLSALNYACSAKSFACAEFLLEMGASVHFTEKSLFAVA
ncbi:TD and POZ domain-containing protein 1 [Caerostris extrusa]|uniref:TD and POZ domain-containing protein 1 n=1 Tax=Caerostris extrusa TaxID=172846 RepID=A0AAV4N9S9_CAEEX|nr:TD and POZ domain-containing protein 1 [Caerostris extrusa]